MFRHFRRFSVQYVYIFAALSLAAGSQAASAQPAQPPTVPAVPLPGEFIDQRNAIPEPRKETPQQQIEMDLRAFVAAVNDGHAFNAFPYIADVRFGFFGATEWHTWWQKTVDRKFTINTVRFDKLEADHATVSVEYSLEPRKGKAADTKPQVETLLLRRRINNDAVFAGLRGGLWTIVTPDKTVDAPWHSLSWVALCLKQPKDFDPTSEIALSHLKQMGLAAFQFVQDYEERFLFDGAHMREALTPYLANTDPFFVPGTQSTWTFNDRLSDLSLAQITEFGKTVMMYEGQNEQPIFRYNGKATILYADGHCAMVNREEAKSLKWTP